MKEYHNQTRRWYDKDPVLSRSLKVLETSDDATQIQMALNLIKIIIEHNIEDEKFILHYSLLTGTKTQKWDNDDSSAFKSLPKKRL